MQEHTLYRSRTDRMIGGVCAGIAQYFELDPTIVRLLAVVLTLLGNGVAVVAYIVLWAVLPEEPLGAGQPVAVAPPIPAGAPAAPVAAPAPPDPMVQGHPREVARGFVWVGVILILVGVAFLMARITSIGIVFWPMAFIGVVFVALGIRTMFTKEDDR